MTPAAPSPIGILGVVQTAFTPSGEIDFGSTRRLVEDALEAGIDGFLVPAVASENGYLNREEKIALASMVQHQAENHVPIIWGTGTANPEEIVSISEIAQPAGAAGLLVAVPSDFYREQDRIRPYFESIAEKTSVPLMIQDLDFNGPGMTIETILDLHKHLPNFRYLKVETVPAGPKYSEVIARTGGALHVSGGWAVTQMIEALDRGVHAMIPECSMIRIYKHIDRLHRSGSRAEALAWFRRLVPILAFTNQHIDVSIRFFKKLLVRKGVFATDAVRLTTPPWDDAMHRVADELVELELELERELGDEG